jgi:plasmid stabilization system protein ParE
VVVQEKVNILKSDPTRFGKRHEEFREVSLKKYPYSIVFLVDEEQKLVVISSIFHQKRNPKTKYKKL